MAKSIRVRDLKDQIGSVGPRPFLYCPKCDAEYSANSGDYFMFSPDHIFRCHGVNMLLVTKRTMYVEVGRDHEGGLTIQWPAGA